jgi:nitrilase
MISKNSFKLAAIQAAPVYFDREKSAEKACGLIKEAGAKGATIAAFGETWLPGYPFFIFAQTQPLTWKALAEYIASAVEIPSPTTDMLCAAAKSAGIDVVIGVRTRSGNPGNRVLHAAVYRCRRSDSRPPSQD